MKSKILLACALTFPIGLSCAPSAHASCGAAVCTLNTNWESQGAWTDPGMRLDLRYDYIKQDQLRAGRDKTQPAGIPDTHDEIQTYNRNLNLGLDYTFDQHWGGSVQLPWINRQHVHVHNETPPETETWKFDTMGDTRVIGRYQFSTETDSQTAWGVNGGFKLPTGDFDETNADGALAERTLQPGSGTTDVIAGIYLNRRMNFETQIATGFLQAQIQYPLNARANFRPGNQYLLDAGMTHRLTSAWSGLWQINAQIKDRDRGGEAEPQDSGGSFLWLSPGLSCALGRATKVYGFVQLPLYQRVNGVQLTADWTATAGASWRF